ncbi:hypothetical protein C2G38_2089177 [Gigaspora rosea]|uniref:FAD-binding PCMH-type domain-containing protein n=1 Tax=Gigaspora rosea TaxID=44941 RepID=A0A397V4Y2_9GLOM|nr:hypothetical protein C2G38_2089177 [Gigaspora rosea]
MVIDVKEFNQITVNIETNTAIIEPGNRLGTIYHELYQAGFLIPAGLFPQGYGAVTRKYGMLCDNIIGIEMVTANGTFISPINSTHHSDLFMIHPILPIITSIIISYTSEQIKLEFLTFIQMVLLNFISDVEYKFVVIFDISVGGVLNKISVNSSAFILRDSNNSKKTMTKCLEKYLRFSQEFQAKYTTYFSYQNYIDRDLDDCRTRYYGHHLPRLVETKKKCDPNNLFN